MRKKKRRTFRQELKQRLKKSTRKRIKITIDEDKRFFRASDLNLHEIDYILEHKDYKVTYQQDLFGEFDYFLVRPSANESVDHFFLVYLIKDFLEKSGIEVQAFNTKKPDIIFKSKNKFVAIEVETGKVLRNNKKQFLEKVNTLDEEFGEDWFFAITNRNLVSKYKKYGKTFTRKRLLDMLSRYVDFSIY